MIEYDIDADIKETLIDTHSVEYNSGNIIVYEISQLMAIEGKKMKIILDKGDFNNVITMQISILCVDKDSKLKVHHMIPTKKDANLLINSLKTCIDQKHPFKKYDRLQRQVEEIKAAKRRYGLEFDKSDFEL